MSCEPVGQTIPGGVVWGEEIQTFRNTLLTPCALSSVRGGFPCGVRVAVVSGHSGHMWARNHPHITLSIRAGAFTNRPEGDL